MKELKERTREWIHKPVFHGAPVSWAQKYFQGRLVQFRQEHPQFDSFLIKINQLMKAEKNEYFANLEQFIDGEAKTNWISPNNTMFDAFIKLFNLCLSPKQSFDYIKECLNLYREISNDEYQLDGELEFTNGRSSWDGSRTKFISFSIKPKNEPKDRGHQYWFNITTDLIIIEDHLNDVILHIDRFEPITCYEKLEDTFMLFEKYQNRGLFRKVFNTGIKELEDKGVIKEISQDNSYGWTIHRYQVNKESKTRRA